LDREEKREKAGVGNMEQVYNFRSQVAQQDLNIVNLRNNLESNRLTLLQLLLLDPSDDYQFEGITTNDAELEQKLADYNTVFEKSMSFSPAVKSAEFSLTASQKNLKASQFLWMPSLSINASYGTGWSSNVKLRDDNNQLIQPVQVLDESTQFDQNRFKQAGLNLNIPLFTRFQNRNQVQQSKIQMLNSELGLEQAKNNLTNLVQQAYLNLVNAKSTYAAAKQSMINLNMAFEFAKSRYENGTIDFVTYLQSLNGKNTGELQLVQAKYTILFRQLILDIYTGEMNNAN
jgi:outer membrane protein